MQSVYVYEVTTTTTLLLDLYVHWYPVNICVWSNYNYYTFTLLICVSVYQVEERCIILPWWYFSERTFISERSQLGPAHQGARSWLWLRCKHRCSSMLMRRAAGIKTPVGNYTLEMGVNGINIWLSIKLIYLSKIGFDRF